MTQPPSAPQKKKSTAVIIIIVLAVLGGCCVISGILAAIAIPNFLKFQGRSKQTEAKATLRALYTAERSMFGDKEVYSENATEIGFSSEGHNYVCLLARDGAPIGNAPNAAELIAAARAHLPEGLGVTGQCPKCNFTAACVGNIDKDSDVDVWSISSGERKGANGQTITGGTLSNDWSDITDGPGE